LIQDDSLDVLAVVKGFIERFTQEVAKRIGSMTA